MSRALSRGSTSSTAVVVNLLRMLGDIRRASSASVTPVIKSGALRTDMPRRGPTRVHQIHTPAGRAVIAASTAAAGEIRTADDSFKSHCQPSTGLPIMYLSSVPLVFLVSGPMNRKGKRKHGPQTRKGADPEGRNYAFPREERSGQGEPRHPAGGARKNGDKFFKGLKNFAGHRRNGMRPGGLCAAHLRSRSPHRHDA